MLPALVHIVKLDTFKIHARRNLNRTLTSLSKKFPGWAGMVFDLP